MMASVNYKLIKNFFSKEELELLQKYCHIKLDINKDYIWDGQSFSPAWYDDPLMNALQDLKLPLVEKESNLKLFQTYTAWRYYVFGATLSKHTDRPSCEISVTACIKKYDNWPIVIEKTPFGDSASFELEEGDGLLYAGCDQKHWRPGIYKGEGMAQVFFHYVNKNGPYTKHAYDNFLKTTGRKK
jgi:alkylated DNA repair dioxygenase AlkB